MTLNPDKSAGTKGSEFEYCRSYCGDDYETVWLRSTGWSMCAEQMTDNYNYWERPIQNYMPYAPDIPVPLS